MSVLSYRSTAEETAATAASPQKMECLPGDWRRQCYYAYGQAIGRGGLPVCAHLHAAARRNHRISWEARASRLEGRIFKRSDPKAVTDLRGVKMAIVVCNGQHWSLWSSPSGFDRRSPRCLIDQRLFSIARRREAIHAC